MGSSHELYTRLFTTLVRLNCDYASNIKQLVTLTWMVVGVLQARSIAPANWPPISLVISSPPRTKLASVAG